MAFESALWKWLKDGSKHMNKNLHLCRVENHITEGYPDVEGCYKSISFHIELKSSKLPKRESTPITIGISDSQINWLKKRSRVGGKCFVLVRVGSHHNIARYIIPGDIIKKKYSREELAEFIIGSAEDIINFCIGS